MFFTPYELVCYIGSLQFKGSAASGFALASGSRDTALTIRLTQLSKRHSGGNLLKQPRD
jgi:hypothetical protein